MSFNKKDLGRNLLCLLFLTLLTDNGYSQPENIQPFRIMFYNVENLFDIYDDTTRDDDDFLPDGVMRWTYPRYNRKINSLYKTIVAAGEWSPPAVVGLCEVENRKVLEDLIYRTYLSKYDYEIVHEESPDIRGIDVCMIYRKDLINLIGYEYWYVSGIQNNGYPTRSVLYSKLGIGHDTIHFIVNHWPSKRGGVLAADDLRKGVAAMVRIKVDSIFGCYGEGARIILTGDFNCSPEDDVMSQFVSDIPSGLFLVNLSARSSLAGPGTYRYMGVWEMIDQVIVSRGLLNSKSGVCTGSKNLSVFSPGFLLESDARYPGLTPFSTYRGYRYNGGFSDHLPVLLDLDFRSPSRQE
jgi:hypothetical protein